MRRPRWFLPIADLIAALSVLAVEAMFGLALIVGLLNLLSALAGR